MKTKADKLKAFWEIYLEYRLEGFIGFSNEGVHIDNKCFRELVPSTAQIKNEINGKYVERTATLENDLVVFALFSIENYVNVAELGNKF